MVFSQKSQVYGIKRRATLVSRIIGEGCSKFCRVVNLTSPVCKHIFSEHTRYWEQLSKKRCIENMKMVVENAKKLVGEDEGLHVDENIIDIPTMFDGSWNNRG